MNNLDFSPLFRSTVGFDQLMRMLDTITHADEPTPSYPPYNIEKTGDQSYRITMAVAGFSPEDLSLTVQENLLIIVGKGRNDAGNSQYLHRGIAARAFERRFQLADFIRVGETCLENGLLSIELLREVPEALKPRQIEIKTSSKKKPALIEQAA